MPTVASAAAATTDQVQNASPEARQTAEPSLNSALPTLDRVSNVPHDLTPWGMFLAADALVKTVMVTLALASLACWTILAAKPMEFSAIRRAVGSARDATRSASSFADAALAVKPLGGAAASLVAAADEECVLSAGLASDGIRDRVKLALTQVEQGAVRKLRFGTGVLATVGAVAPFVGLFGTVWGIMNSFVGISRAQTTNLAVVAPGIAEALLATALGLFAAIPAVVIYNAVTRAIASHRALLADLSTDLIRLVGRDLDRGVLGRPVDASRKAVDARRW